MADKSRGSTRMREQGFIATTVWLMPKWAGFVRYTAAGQGLPLASFVRLVALAVAGDKARRREVEQQLDFGERAVFRSLCDKLPSLSMTIEDEESKG